MIMYKEKNAVKFQNLSSTVCVFGQVSGESRPPEKRDLSSDKQSAMKKIRLCPLFY